MTGVQTCALPISPRQTNASLRLSVVDDALSEPDESFFVNLTSVRASAAYPPSPDARPRLAPRNRVAKVTILASDVTGGVLSIGPALVQTSEDREEGAEQERSVVLRVRRSDSLVGAVRVRVRAYGGGSPGASPLPFNGTLALEGQDFRLEEEGLVALQEGQVEALVSLLILDDSEPEGQEVFFVYLSDPEGGAQIGRASCRERVSSPV